MKERSEMKETVAGEAATSVELVPVEHRPDGAAYTVKG